VRREREKQEKSWQNKGMSDGDTICAVATPSGRGGVGVIRLSGPASFSLAEGLCGKLPPLRQAGLRQFADPNGELIDTGLVITFKAPASFTGEDVVELHTHGSPVVLEILQRSLVEAGARRARPGEFSERAFINDRIDLAQAEAIADLIGSASEQAARAASRSLEGALSRQAEALATALTELRVWIEAALDFPDEDVDFLADGQVAERVAAVLEDIESLLERSRSGRLLADGVRIAIIGKPNAGKSSLLNALTRSDSAIVTEIPGTTRDVLRETVTIAGMPVVLSDTAGLRETADQVEIEGVRRAQREMQTADLIFWVVEATDPDPHRPQGLPESVPCVRINNKIDLTAQPPGAARGQVNVSARTGAGLKALEKTVLETLGLDATTGGEFSARQRHVEAIEKAVIHVRRGLSEICTTGSGELLAEELKGAADSLGEITGRLSSDELLGRIFSSFCIGK
jgi:tRNA modification GTPase